MMLNNNKEKQSNNNSEKPKLSDEDIENIDLNDKKVKNWIEKYENETGKFAIWRDSITEGFKKWLKGEKIYLRDKERISLYVSDKTKAKWQEFIDKHKKEYKTFSKLIRDSVNAFIETIKNNKLDQSEKELKKISRISHALKEPLTTIKGYAQLLLESEEYKDKLTPSIRETIKNIFEQSNLLEDIIRSFLDNIKETSEKIDVLLIEDDLSTIKLIKRIFESKGYTCKGVISGLKGLRMLERMQPKIILLDIILPDSNGYEICKILKSDKRWKDIPIYFLTAISATEVKKNLKETKADGYILKPFNFSDFEIIFHVLKNQKK
ncbi:MAG: ATP-binding response regulator [Promethearchaeota archaeon]